MTSVTDVWQEQRIITLPGNVEAVPRLQPTAQPPDLAMQKSN